MVALSNRRTRYTASPIGLVLGLFGTLVSAAFTYLITVRNGSFYLDPHSTVERFTDLARIGGFPVPQWPLVVLAPALPVLALIAVPLCSLSAARSVGPRLMTRPRLACTAAFTAVTLLGLLTTPFGPALIPWLGPALISVALAYPHRED
ncbi:hypothetical protein GCM10010174_85330 [Kutzneria viridogrisea]|uniref:Secreted protein n=1 Tax=Kutzneria viridogrisea TaxID=47990 RepID=A0ABR6BVV7_9PSEU|nr:hypothetical protein [Kutzneria viridogrisea]